MKKSLPVFFLILFSCFIFTGKNFSQDSLRAGFGMILSDTLASDTLKRVIIPADTIRITEVVTLPFSISGYVDTYYSKDNDLDHSLERFPGVSAHRDEFRLNIAQISLKYQKENVRGNLTIQYGDEPDLFWPADHKFLQEANAGFSPWNNVWIDAGYFVTHMGTESIRPMENTFSTFAMTTFCEPFPQAGVVVSYRSLKFTGAFHLMNGYNLIPDNNKTKSIGVSLAYRPYKNVEFIYNNIAGNESADLENQKLRLYNNFIFKGTFGNHWAIVINNDLCLQQKSKIDDDTKMGYMAGGFLSGQYRINPKFALALRGEYFADFDGIMLGVYTNPIGEMTGLQVFGPSLAFEYKPMENAYVRVEGRYLKTMKNLQVFSDGREYRVDGNITMGVGF